MNIKSLIISLFIITVSIVQAAGTLAPANSGMKPAEIISHDVTVTINNGFAQTEVTQQFKNINDAAMEAIYSFPVPKSASMSECHVQIGEKVLNGEVLPKKDVRQIYEDESKAGNHVARADKDGFQDFTFKIANVNPQDTATITFTYYQPLPIDTGTCRYSYPLEEGNTKDDAALSFWERNDKPTGKTTIHVIVRSAWPLTAVRAPYGSESDRQEDLAQGQFDAKYELSDGLSRDFIFYYNLANNLPGRLEVVPYKQPGKDGTFMMVLTPGIDLKPLVNGADYIFVLDNSGSMCGGKLQTLVKGVQQTIGKLNPQDRFRVIFFSDSAKDITRGYQCATPENVKATIEKLNQVTTEGCTNMYDGLKMALSKLDTDRVSSLILVTDGVVNSGEVTPQKFVKLLQAQDIRVFGFLMGNQGNWPLMRVICDVSGGFYEGVSNDDDIIGKILLAKSKITTEAMHDAKITIKGIDTYDVTNQCLKKLYRGQQMVMFGRYKQGGKASVVMTTKISGQEHTYKCECDFPDDDQDNPELERLWALAQIEMHEDMMNQGLGEEKEQQDVIRNLGVNYQLVTDETSMIILDDEGHNRHQIQRRNQARVQAERTAQSARKNQPVKHYHHDMGFKIPAPRLGGGGAFDPWSVFIIGSVATMFYTITRKKH